MIEDSHDIEIACVADGRSKIASRDENVLQSLNVIHAYKSAKIRYPGPHVYSKGHMWSNQAPIVSARQPSWCGSCS